jgi:hypothetical protein
MHFASYTLPTGIFCICIFVMLALTDMHVFYNNSKKKGELFAPPLWTD